MESSIARAIAVASGNPKPSVDDLASTISVHSNVIARILRETHGTKKSRAVLMMIAAITLKVPSLTAAADLAMRIGPLVHQLELALLPETAERCWGEGAAFTLAMSQAVKIVENT